MISIYICDDDRQIMAEIAEKINRKIMIEDYDMKVAGTYTSPRDLLNAVFHTDNKSNIYFLDVDLKDENLDGFLLGKEIRKYDVNGIIIYITSFTELAYKTFQYHIEAFDYIVKNAGKLEESIEQCLQEIENKLLNNSKSESADTFLVKMGDSLKHIKMDDIYFFETAPKAHHVIMHTRNGRMDFAGHLHDIEKQTGECFMRIHRSYLVALKHIREVNIKESYAVAGKQRCPVSKRMKSKLLTYMDNGGK